MESPGEYLKREREIRGISLEDISGATKIRARLLNAIENNDFDALPAAPFVKGFIQAYCNYLGLDAQDALLRYESYARGIEEKKTAALAIEKESEACPRTQLSGVSGHTPEAHRPYQPLSIIAIAAIALLVIIAGVYITSKRHASTAPDYSQPQTEGSVAESKNAAPPQQLDAENRTDISNSAASSTPLKQEETPIKEAPPVQDVKKENLTLVIEAVKPAWIKAEIDGRTPFEVSLRDGERVKWTAKEKFSILIGNAGGVHVIFNGNPLKRLGEAGEVVRLILPEESVDTPETGLQPQNPTL